MYARITPLRHWSQVKLFPALSSAAFEAYWVAARRVSVFSPPLAARLDGDIGPAMAGYGRRAGLRGGRDWLLTI